MFLDRALLKGANYAKYPTWNFTLLPSGVLLLSRWFMYGVEMVMACGITHRPEGWWKPVIKSAYCQVAFQRKRRWICNHTIYRKDLLINLSPLSKGSFAEEELNNWPTQVLSDIERIRGAYGDGGIDVFCDGDPKPDIPDTLYLLLEEVEIVGRAGGNGGGLLARFWRLGEEVEVVSVGGVLPPYVEFNVDEDCVFAAEPLVPLLESALPLVRKLAFDRRRMSLKNEGAIVSLRRVSGLPIPGLSK